MSIRWTLRHLAATVALVALGWAIVVILEREYGAESPGGVPLILVYIALLACCASLPTLLGMRGNLRRWLGGGTVAALVAWLAPVAVALVFGQSEGGEDYGVAGTLLIPFVAFVIPTALVVFFAGFAVVALNRR